MLLQQDCCKKLAGHVQLRLALVHGPQMLCMCKQRLSAMTATAPCKLFGIQVRSTC